MEQEADRINMSDYNLREIIQQYKDEINYLSKNQVLSTSIEEKNQYLNYINDRTENLIRYLEETLLYAQQTNTEGNVQREFTLEELATFNGSEGKPAYVAINGVVYDMSNKAGWAGGTHYGLFAGKDLTQQYKSCHLGAGVILDSLPKVGVLKQ